MENQGIGPRVGPLPGSRWEERGRCWAGKQAAETLKASNHVSEAADHFGIGLPFAGPFGFELRRARTNEENPVGRIGHAKGCHSALNWIIRKAHRRVIEALANRRGRTKVKAHMPRRTTAQMRVARSGPWRPCQS